MITVSNVTVAFGGYVLLDGINFHISEQDKIGLVGKNGAGKSTLMKLITGEQAPTSGSIEKPSGIRIGYLPQVMKHHKGHSVMQEVLSVFDHLKTLEAELQRITEELSVRTDYDSREYAGLIERLNEINDALSLESGLSPEAQAQRVLLGLGFKADELDRNTETFSQGCRDASACSFAASSFLARILSSAPSWAFPSRMTTNSSPPIRYTCSSPNAFRIRSAACCRYRLPCSWP